MQVWIERDYANFPFDLRWFGRFSRKAKRNGWMVQLFPKQGRNGFAGVPYWSQKMAGVDNLALRLEVMPMKKTAVDS